MLCQVSTANVSTDLAVFGPGGTLWQYPADNSVTGVEAYHQSGIYCSTISADRIASVLFVCEATATTPYIAAATTPGTCVHRVTVRTNLACGGGSRGNDTELIYSASTLSQCNRVQGASYDAALCPRPVSQRAPIALTGPTTQVLVGSATGTANATLQFPFWFYGNSYTVAQIGVNGVVHFGTPTTATPTSPPAYGFTTPASYPMILAFGTSMSNAVYAGLNSPNVTYTHQTFNGRRAFIVRYWNMKYTSFRGMYDMIVNLDVILTEGEPGGVEIRYYTVSANPLSQVSIGIHGPDALDVYTGMVNYEWMTVTLANQLQGATLNYTYTGRTLVDACAAYGVNFTNLITTDMVLTSGNFTYYLAPCGQLRSNVSGCRTGTSVCQVGAAGSTVVSSFNPSAIVWSPAPAPLLGLRSTLRDGAFCTANNQPRTVQIDWICSKLYSVPTLISFSEVTTCVYNAQIGSLDACASTVACSNIASARYSGSLCPTVAPIFAQTSPVSVLANQDDAVVRVRLPVQFHFYGQVYRNIWIGSNGQLSFGPVAANYLTGSLPLASSQLDSTPLIAAWMSNLNIVNGSTISYSTETFGAERAFVVRYRNVETFGNTLDGISDTVSFDVLMFEGVSGKLEIRYYTMNQPSTAATVTVGLQNDDVDPEESLVLTNARAIDAGVAASFTNSTLRIFYSGPDVLTEFCGGNGYNLTALTTQDINFVNGTTSYALRVCGIVADTQCQASATSDQAMFCRKTSASVSTMISEWNPAENYYLYPSSATGLMMVTQNGPYCTTGSINAPTVTILNFVCLSTATTATITSVTDIASCTIQVNISTNLVCGAGNRASPVPIPQSTLTACRNLTGNFYDATLCPRATDDANARPQAMVNPVRILSTDNAAVVVNFGFDVYVYGRVETNVAISSNGLLSFGMVANSQNTPAAFPTLGLNNDAYPSIAAFFSDLINLDTMGGAIPYTGFIQYSYFGTAPNRGIIIRFQDVDYFATRNSVAEQSVSFDVVMTEGNATNPGSIEVRYYVVDAAAQQNVVVGMHGYDATFTQVANLQPITRAFAAEMTGSTLRYRFTGTAQPDVCGGIPGGYNLTSIAQDLNFNTSSYQFYLRPCGTVQNTVCTSKYGTQQAHVCQATLNGATTWSLAGTSQPVYSNPSMDILRATVSDGLLCGANPRRSIIDYTCDATATRPYINYVNENSTCVYYIRVITAAACVNVRIPGIAANSTTPRYDARLFYDAPSMSSKLPQTAPTAVMAGADDDQISLAIPFPVSVYGANYTSVKLSVNGFMMFGAGSGSTGTPTQGFPLAAAYTTALPVLAPFLTDLHNTNLNGTASISWSVEGVAPNRFFFIRYNAVNYYSTRPASSTPLDKVISFDVKFYESSNTIDVLYWQAPTHTSVISIGLQGPSNAYTPIINSQTVADRGLFLENYLLRFTYVDPLAPVPSSSSSSSSSTAGASSSTSPSSSSASATSTPSTSSSTTPAVSSSSGSTPAVSSSAARSSSSSSAAAPSSSATTVASSTTTPSVSSSARSSSSSSATTPTTTSSTSPVSTTSSSTSVGSSTGSLPVPTAGGVSSSRAPNPAGSVHFTLTISLPYAVNASNQAVVTQMFARDVATNLARAYNTTADQLLPYIVVTLTSVPAVRRLLANDVQASVTILGTVSQQLGTDASQAGNTVVSQVTSGSFTTLSSGADVPRTQTVIVESAEPPSDSTAGGGHDHDINSAFATQSSLWTIATLLVLGLLF